jgi:hypothetical protein
MVDVASLANDHRRVGGDIRVASHPQAFVPPSRSARLGQPAAERTLEGFFRAMRALIGNPFLNGTASAMV